MTHRSPIGGESERHKGANPAPLPHPAPGGGGGRAIDKCIMQLLYCMQTCQTKLQFTEVEKLASFLSHSCYVLLQSTRHANVAQAEH